MQVASILAVAFGAMGTNAAGPSFIGGFERRVRPQGFAFGDVLGRVANRRPNVRIGASEAVRGDQFFGGRVQEIQVQNPVADADAVRLIETKTQGVLAIDRAADRNAQAQGAVTATDATVGFARRLDLCVVVAQRQPRAPVEFDAGFIVIGQVVDLQPQPFRRGTFGHRD